MIKVAVIYTATTPELIDLVEKELKRSIPEAQLLTYQDETILAEVRQADYVTSVAAARLVTLFMEAVKAGADVIYNCCSSVGEVADSMGEFGRFCGVPVVRIDEEMCRDAARRARRIGVMATVTTTLEPTKRTILRTASEIGRQVELVDVLIEGAFGRNREQMSDLMAKKAVEVGDKVDALLLAQGSMACCEAAVAAAVGLPVFSSPRYGALAVRHALEWKGLINKSENGVSI